MQGGNWGLHNIDKALLSYYNLREHKPELLKNMPDKKEVKRKEVASQEEDTKDKAENKQENGTENGTGHPTPDIKAADEDFKETAEEIKETAEEIKEAAPEPEPEKPVKSPGGEKRPLEDEDDDDSQDSVEASEAKRPRPEEAGGEAESPHKANLSTQLIAC